MDAESKEKVVEPGYSILDLLISMFAGAIVGALLTAVSMTVMHS